MLILICIGIIIVFVILLIEGKVRPPCMLVVVVVSLTRKVALILIPIVVLSMKITTIMVVWLLLTTRYWIGSIVLTPGKGPNETPNVNGRGEMQQMIQSFQRHSLPRQIRNQQPTPTAVLSACTHVFGIQVRL